MRCRDLEIKYDSQKKYIKIIIIFFYVCLVGDWVSPIPIYSGCGRGTSQFHPGDDNADIYISTGQLVHLSALG